MIALNYNNGLLSIFMRYLVKRLWPIFSSPSRIGGGAVESVLAAQSPQFVLWMPIFFGLGVSAYFGAGHEPGAAVCAGLIVGALACMVAAARWRPDRIGGRVLRGSILFFMLVLAGFGAGKMRSMVVDAPMLSKTIRVTNIEGTIQSLEYLREGRGVRVILGDLMIEKVAPEDTPRFVRINMRDNLLSAEEEIRPGRRIRVLAQLSPPSPPVMAGAFDFQHYAYFKQIGAFGFAYRAPELLAGGDLWHNALEQYRTSLAKAAREIVQAPQSSIVIALLIGERAAMPDDVWEHVRIAGLAHIIAISGMNIGMVASMAFFISRALMALFPAFAVRRPIKSYAAVIAFIAAFAYALVVGMTVPTFRALITTGLFLFAIAIGRSPFSLRLAAFSALALMIFYPDVLIGASFQMSFAAVVMLIWFYDATRDWWVGAFKNAGWPMRIAIYLFGVCLTTVLATIATAPFSIYHFQQLSTYGVLANLIVVPIASFWIMPWALVAYIAVPMGWGALPLGAMAAGVDVMLWVAKTVSGWPHASFLFSAWPPLAFAASVSGMIFVILWQGRARWLGLGAMIVACVAILHHRSPDMIVSPGAKLVMIRAGDDEVWLSSRMHDRFAARTWLQQAGISPDQVVRFPREGALENDHMRLLCGEGGCRLTLKNDDGHSRKIAISTHFLSQADDCGWADLIISAEPLKPEMCEDKMMVDFFDLGRRGAHSFYFAPARKGMPGDWLKIRTVDDRGPRPWAVGNTR